MIGPKGELSAMDHQRFPAGKCLRFYTGADNRGTSPLPADTSFVVGTLPDVHSLVRGQIKLGAGLDVKSAVPGIDIPDHAPIFSPRVK